MSEQNVMFLVNLSHKWEALLLLLPLFFGTAVYFAGVLQSRARTSGSGKTLRFATALRRVWGALLVGSLFLLLLGISHFGCAIVSARQHQCRSNLKLLAEGALLYAQDYDDRLPRASAWSEEIAPWVKKAVELHTDSERDPFVCPSAETPAGYGMNSALGGLSLSNEKFTDIDAPADTVLLFDAVAPFRSYAGGAEILARNRHAHVPTIAYADGHVKNANAYYMNALIWTAKKQ